MTYKQDKINVLFIIIQMEMGGSERLVHTLVSSLDRSIFNPSVAWFYGREPQKEFKSLNVPLYHIGKEKRFDVYAMKKIAHIIKTSHIHVVNAHHFMSMIYAFYGCRKNQARLITTFHSIWEIDEIEWYWKIIGRRLLNRSDSVIGVSNDISRKAKEYFELQSLKVKTIFNGVDLNLLSNTVPYNPARELLGMRKDDVVIGVVANLRKIKNHIFLLRAFKALIDDGNQAKLVLIGKEALHKEDSTKEEINAYVSDNKLQSIVYMLGYRSDVHSLLGIMDIFCLTSKKEGMPISLLEAMAAGLPVIGTDVEGIRDVIMTGKNGYLVPDGDINTLRQKLECLVKDATLRKEMGTQSRIMAERYSLDSCIEQYKQLFLTHVR